ncbi:MAG TPA: hypothetical protein VFO01_02530 [Trebonia sp.]|nr:hypothetical protein [Trebonia sp.]
MTDGCGLLLQAFVFEKVGVVVGELGTAPADGAADSIRNGWL